MKPNKTSLHLTSERVSSQTISDLGLGGSVHVLGETGRFGDMWQNKFIDDGSSSDELCRSTNSRLPSYHFLTYST
ncbi:hypothetical protein X798_03012 [Onchocerca flexuosa]|uniref:Uncharacterized protein n=1 Tax=Onchocerca flexuosa TaxID=387005 RepID=A0A238BYA4_9BILA|nr:hypothetical protein X798_03012 [Onchocerca flexuosa]